MLVFYRIWTPWQTHHLFWKAINIVCPVPVVIQDKTRPWHFRSLLTISFHIVSWHKFFILRFSLHPALVGTLVQNMNFLVVPNTDKLHPYSQFLSAISIHLRASTPCPPLWPWPHSHCITVHLFSSRTPRTRIRLFIFSIINPELLPGLSSSLVRSPDRHQWHYSRERLINTNCSLPIPSHSRLLCARQAADMGMSQIQAWRKVDFTEDYFNFAKFHNIQDEVNATSTDKRKQWSCAVLLFFDDHIYENRSYSLEMIMVRKIVALAKRVRVSGLWK